ncbi:hypothetical protein APHAL10511_006115 [Amanita phalloides]|nr:hypothetical protein APHAL10511_006115 [Amanita phalloides]
MAVSADFTILNLTGKFMLNKTLSDDTDKILELQGVGWFTRKAIAIATIRLFINHYKDDDGIEHIDIKQTLTGGIPGTTENRILWWKEGKREDKIFGPVIGKSRRCTNEELSQLEEYLTKEWTEDTYQHGLVQAHAKSDTAKSGRIWTANQTWGIENINNERRYSRHVYFVGPQDQVIEARLVYDYLGRL